MKNDNTRPSLVVGEGASFRSKYGSEILNQLTEMLSILSKNDALTIFLTANDGIKSELDTPSKLGLTKKQYYTRLKQLVDLGLLVKQDDSYIHTALGRLVYQKHIVGLTSHIKNSKYFEMVDVLKTNPKFNDNDIMEFISKVYPQATIDLETSLASSFDEMVNRVLEMVEFAHKQILLATRFQNELIINSVLKKANSGINVKVLADIDLVENYFEKEKIGIKRSDKNDDERINVVSNPYYPSKVDRRYIQVPFCILVVDNKHAGFEIVDAYEPGKFKMAVFVEDRILSSSLIQLFNDLWLKSSVNPPKIATKSIRGTI